MDIKHLINNQIKANKILLLDRDGEKIGEKTFQEAIELAHKQDLDLVQFGYNVKDNVAICKILKYESFIYHENKNKAKQDFQSRKTELKCISFTHKIGEKDYNMKLKKVKEFIEEGRKVKIVVNFGTFREANNRDVTEPFMEKVLQSLKEIGSLDSDVSKNNFREVMFMLKPKKIDTEKKQKEKMKM